MISKYLSDIGIKKDSLSWNWKVKGISRNIELAKERKIHGFDSRDTWELSETAVSLIYPRLKMYKEKAVEIQDGLEYRLKDILRKEGNNISNT